jgi:hypothetical protein
MPSPKARLNFTLGQQVYAVNDQATFAMAASTSRTAPGQVVS